MKQQEHSIPECIEEELENNCNEVLYLPHREMYLEKVNEKKHFYSIQENLPIKLETFSPFFGSKTKAKLFPAAEREDLHASVSHSIVQQGQNGFLTDPYCSR